MMGYYSAIKKNEIVPSVTTWMALEGITLSEISQTEKEEYLIISSICEGKKTNKQKQTCKSAVRERELRSTGLQL